MKRHCFTKMVEGHPVTYGGAGETDRQLIGELTEEEKTAVLGWIDRNIWESGKVCEYHSSYGIKHVMTRDTGVYVTNNQFKDAMLQCGFVPGDEGELNWHFSIDDCSPAFVPEGYRRSWDGKVRRSPFREFMKGKRRCSGPTGNVAYYSLMDLNFPWDGTMEEIRRYLVADGARGKYLKAFDRAWKKYAGC